MSQSNNDLWVDENVNGIRLDVWEIMRNPEDRGDPYYAKTVAIDVETVDSYGRIVARTGLQLSPYQCKALIERINMTIDATKARA
jgi:hypothetical protein